MKKLRFIIVTALIVCLTSAAPVFAKSKTTHKNLAGLKCKTLSMTTVKVSWKKHKVDKYVIYKVTRKNGKEKHKKLKTVSGKKKSVVVKLGKNKDAKLWVKGVKRKKNGKKVVYEGRITVSTKVYYLPKETYEYYYEEGEGVRITDIKYDKYGNPTSACVEGGDYLQFKIKYRNKKGVLASVTYSDGEFLTKKFYDKKGYLTKVKLGWGKGDVYEFTKNDKQHIVKVSLDGKPYSSIDSLEYHENGFVSKLVCDNGFVYTYNADGLLSSITNAEGEKFTYKYTKKNGKVVKAVLKDSAGSTLDVTTLKYGKARTKNVWKYSCAMDFANGPSDISSIYAKSSVSGLEY